MYLTISFCVYRSLDEILQQIDYTIINNLRNSIHIALNKSLCTKTIIDTYLMLAQYCLNDLNYIGIYNICTYFI